MLAAMVASGSLQRLRVTTHTRAERSRLPITERSGCQACLLSYIISFAKRYRRDLLQEVLT